MPTLGLLVVVGLVVRAVLGKSSDISRSLHLLANPEPGLVALAVLLEVLSYLSYARGQQVLARATGRTLRLPWLAALAISAQALLDFLPAGYIPANVLNFRELRRRGLAGAICAWLLGLTSLLYIGALLVIACAGAVIDAHGGWVPRLLGALALVAIAAIAAVSTGALTGGPLPALRRVPLALIAWLERRQGLPARLAGGSRDVARQMAAVRLTRGEVAQASVLFAIGWLSDAGCLACGFGAVGVLPPWDSLPVAYAIAQLVAFLPVTPGGLGLVEGSLAVTLTGGGRSLSEVLAAILLYRGLSYWATLPAGAVGYVALRHARTHNGKLVGG